MSAAERLNEIARDVRAILTQLHFEDDRLFFTPITHPAEIHPLLDIVYQYGDQAIHYRLDIFRLMRLYVTEPLNAKTSAEAFLVLAEHLNDPDHRHKRDLYLREVSLAAETIARSLTIYMQHVSKWYLLLVQVNPEQPALHRFEVQFALSEETLKPQTIGGKVRKIWEFESEAQAHIAKHACTKAFMRFDNNLLMKLNLAVQLINDTSLDKRISPETIERYYPELLEQLDSAIEKVNHAHHE